MQIDFDRFEGCNQSKIKIIHSSSPVLTTAQRQYSDGKMVYTDVNGPMIKEPYNEIKYVQYIFILLLLLKRINN